MFNFVLNIYLTVKEWAKILKYLDTPLDIFIKKYNSNIFTKKYGK